MKQNKPLMHDNSCDNRDLFPRLDVSCDKNNMIDVSCSNDMQRIKNIDIYATSMLKTHKMMVMMLCMSLLMAILKMMSILPFLPKILILLLMLSFISMVMMRDMFMPIVISSMVMA